MDARLNVFAILGLEPGDAHVLRNAGGRVTDDVIRSLALSQVVLGTKEVRVIHHTDCAMTKIDDAEAAEQLEAVLGVPPDFDVLAFSDDERAVRDDVEALRRTPFLPHRDRISGYLYDVDARILTPVRSAALGESH